MKKFNEEILFDDGENDGSMWVQVELTSRGLEVEAGNHANCFGTTFTVEELEAILAKLKGLQ